MMKQRPIPKPAIKERVLSATSTFISYLLPFTSAIPVHLSRTNTSDRNKRPPLSHHTSHPSHTSYSSYNDLGADVILRTPQRHTPQRKGSWISKPRSERRQSCRRVKSQRDWSGELEESEFHLPFMVEREERERGGGGERRYHRDGRYAAMREGMYSTSGDYGGYIGETLYSSDRNYLTETSCPFDRGYSGEGSYLPDKTSLSRPRRMVSFRDEIQLPKLDTASLGQGLMIDMDEISMDEGLPGSATTESSESSGMTRGSEWTEFSEEAEGIELLF